MHWVTLISSLLMIGAGVLCSGLVDSLVGVSSLLTGFSELEKSIVLWSPIIMLMSLLLLSSPSCLAPCGVGGFPLCHFEMGEWAGRVSSSRLSGSFMEMQMELRVWNRFLEVVIHVWSCPQRLLLCWFWVVGLLWWWKEKGLCWGFGALFVALGVGALGS